MNERDELLARRKKFNTKAMRELIKKYLTDNSPNDPLRTTPYLPPQTIDYLESILHPDMNVLEYGAGGSTVWLHTRVDRIHSIETNRAWYEKLWEYLPNCVIYHPDLEMGIFSDQLKKAIFSLGPYDLIFADGHTGGRNTFIMNTYRYLAPGGWLVIDNASKPDYKKAITFIEDLDWWEFKDVCPAPFPELAAWMDTNFYRRKHENITEPT